MQDVPNIGGLRWEFAADDRVAIERRSTRLVRLPLKEAFETSLGRIDWRLIFLGCVEGKRTQGVWEVVAAEECF